MLQLKSYQSRALAVLADFLETTRKHPLTTAYANVLAKQDRTESYHALFENIPCVCLRVPTGGGKTLMAAHSIALAGKALLDTDAPLALWLTPSDTIRSQTLEALRNARHPYRQALAHDFGDGVRICDLESLQTINPHEVGTACIVVVATIQSFNVSDTAKRNVYSFFEELAPHFEHLAAEQEAGLEQVKPEDLAVQPYLTQKNVGRVKYSVANWLNLQRPVVIVDEAHNNRTHRFFQTLGRLNPSCIIEWTATPVTGNNVLYHVSAQELKAEDMVKLPIVLVEHPDSWQACLRDAILTRQRLAIEAQHETEYLRPIVLIQAMPKGGEATVEVVRDYLIEQEHIPAEQIAVATGTQKELDGINLFDRACKILYVITVEALKEGWDCSFAYVLASLQSVKSSKDVEQLLGRVLRMPYAKSRAREALNKAYAHIIADNFAQAAENLKDRMVQNMGFERLETASLVVPQEDLVLPLPDGEAGNPQAKTRLIDGAIQLPELPDTRMWPDNVKAAVEVHRTTQGATVLLKGTMDRETLQAVEQTVMHETKPKYQKAVKAQFDEYRAMRRARQAPSQLGEHFARIPQLCLLDGEHLERVEREMLADLGEWDLLGQPVQLHGFAIKETVHSFEIDVNGERVKYKSIGPEQLRLNEMITQVTERDLVRWLDVQVRRPDVSQVVLQSYLVKMVAHLIGDRNMSLTALVRAKFQLAAALKTEIARLHKEAISRGFQRQLQHMTVPSSTEMASFSFQYQPGQYPATRLYAGSYEFQKHFYPVIHDLREKTAAGKTSEEFVCARAIDVQDEVKYWVRNIEAQPRFSFWLPTGTDYFYPDFVAELHDGRILVVEYKGEPYKTNDDSRQKRQVGEQWARASQKRCLFLFAVADDHGRDVHQQISAAIR